MVRRRSSVRFRSTAPRSRSRPYGEGSRADVAQLVEHCTRNAKVASSILAIGSKRETTRKMSSFCVLGCNILAHFRIMCYIGNGCFGIVATFPEMSFWPFSFLRTRNTLSEHPEPLCFYRKRRGFFILLSYYS